MIGRFLFDQGEFYVQRVYQDTSAFKAGIKEQDEIVKINGKRTDKISMLYAYSLLFYEPGTKVTLTIERNNQEKDYVLVSDRFTVSVRGLTPEQVKRAKNWEKACYDPDFRYQLGLSRAQTEECKKLNN